MFPYLFAQDVKRGIKQKNAYAYVIILSCTKMGGEQSQESALSIPTCLKDVNTFLMDAYKAWKQSELRDGLCCDAELTSLKKLCLVHIQQAFHLIPIVGVTLDPSGKGCLEYFKNIHEIIAKELKLECELESPLAKEGVLYKFHEQLLAEADCILRIAEDYLKENYIYEACLYYHMASLFYLRQFSSMRTNFTQERFFGTICSDVYDIKSENKLGKGSYGSVYLAYHRETGIPHAVKAMNVAQATSYYLRKLHLEVSLLKEIDHPNIIKLKDVFFGRRTVYLVTNLCRGGELFELLNTGKKRGYVFREDRGAMLIGDMFSAVHHLHSQGIVHRDLKLENFLFEEKSSTSSLILIDFGLSRRFDGTEMMSQRVGSCYYTAPEVLKGDYDYKCDIWSLGVLAYMILSGSPPFGGKTVEDVYEATRTREPSFPENKFRHLSTSCIDFLKRLLVKDPEKRMTSAEALNHPFLLQKTQTRTDHLATSSSDSNLGMHIVQRISKFMAATPMIKLFLSVFSTMLTVREMSPFREEFYLLDNRREGLITLGGFYNGLMCAPSVVSGDVDLYAAYDAIAVSMNHRHAGGILYREYITATMLGVIRFDDSRIKVCFDLLDIDNQGHLTAESLRKALGDDLQEIEYLNVVSEGDRNNNGRVTYDDFFHRWKAFENEYLLRTRLEVDSGAALSTSTVTEEISRRQYDEMNNNDMIVE
eukprot:GSChrysophyteH1.ASY1.ANO1.2170.1 assembled CDS